MLKYTETYNLFKNMIANGSLAQGEKMPSIRRAAQLYRISRTTVQNAYYRLADEGYIYAKPQSGYFVSGISPEKQQHATTKTDKPEIKFDLTGTSADITGFDFSLWQRYIKSALRQKERLLSYSEPQGEADLRETLSEYVRERRNVIASPNQIVVGAGVQMLLEILCVLLSDRKSVSFPDSSFVQGSAVFEAHGFELGTRNKDADIIYVSPSHMSKKGDVMPISRRLELCEYSASNNAVVIEDDYENDFIYSSTPTPSLFALGKGNVIYMGSFSALMLPCIRISFMVLNSELACRYEKIKDRFAQTSSKTEQIALCAYLRDGNMKSRAKKIRRLYTSKTKRFLSLLKKYTPEIDAQIGENGLQVIINTNFTVSQKMFEQAGITVNLQCSKNNGNLFEIIVSPSAIEAENLETAAKALSKVLEKAKRN